MLTVDEHDYVVALLVEEAQLAGQPRQALLPGLYDHLAAQFPSGTPFEMACLALELCIQDGYARTPPALVKLLGLLSLKDARIPPLIGRLSVPPAPTPDVFDAVILDTAQPFLARSHTRANLRALLNDKPVQPLVVINGERRMGKSYTASFIEHVLRPLPDTQHCTVELAEKQGASVGAWELACDIVTQVGGDPAVLPRLDTNRDRWTKELANVVVADVKRSGLKWWIVLDGFNATELRADTRLFIEKLSMSITTGMGQRLIRLILIDFDRALLPLAPGKIALEIVSPIPKSAVATCVAKIAEKAPSSANLDSSLLLARVMSGLTDPVTDLPELGLRLDALIRTVEQRA